MEQGKKDLLVFLFKFPDNTSEGKTRNLYCERKGKNMNIGGTISVLRKEHGMTQKEFGEMFHVTRQTVSNWENEKSYPDLHTLVEISNRFGISLDTLLKEDQLLVEKIDKERNYGKMKREKSVIDFLTGAGTGIVVSCLASPDSVRRTAVILVGLIMIGIGWYKKSVYDKAVMKYLEE